MQLACGFHHRTELADGRGCLSRHVLMLNLRDSSSTRDDSHFRIYKEDNSRVARIRIQLCPWSACLWSCRCIRTANDGPRSEEHTSELQSHSDLVCRLLLEKKKKQN